MRFLTLLAFVPLALSLAPNVAPRAVSNIGAITDALSLPDTVFVNAQNKAFVCKDFQTRKENCRCRDGLIKPNGYKPGNAMPADNCRCDDSKNSVGYEETNRAGVTVLKCSCPHDGADGIYGNDQYYDYNMNRCVCQDSLVETRTGGVLSCTPPAQPSPKTGSGRRRSLKSALEQRKLDAESRAVENTLQCKASEKACQVGADWSCVDLTTCGGCAGEAVDCGALPNVSEVHCSAGQCVIDSCARGFKLVHPLSARGTTTTQAATCQPIRRLGSSYFEMQGARSL